MPEKLSARVERLENLMGALAEAQLETERRFQETDARIDKLATEAAERDRALDARIDKLVSAIGELISRIPPSSLTPSSV